MNSLKKLSILIVLLSGVTLYSSQKNQVNATINYNIQFPVETLMMGMPFNSWGLYLGDAGTPTIKNVQGGGGKTYCCPLSSKTGKGLFTYDKTKLDYSVDIRPGSISASDLLQQGTTQKITLSPCGGSTMQTQEAGTYNSCNIPPMRFGEDCYYGDNYGPWEWMFFKGLVYVQASPIITSTNIEQTLSALVGDIDMTQYLPSSNGAINFTLNIDFTDANPPPVTKVGDF